MSSNPLRSQRQSRYGWVVVAVSAIVNSLAWSVRSTFAAFYVALLGEFAWRRGEAALGYSLSWLLLLVFSPLAGWLYDRWGARLLVPAGGLLLGAALAADRSGDDALAVLPRLRRPRRRGHRLHPDSGRRHRQPMVRSFAWRGDGRHQRGRLGQRHHLLPPEHVPDRRLRLAHGAGDLRPSRGRRDHPARRLPLS